MGRGDLGRAIGVVLDPPLPDLDRAEDGLEGERGRAAAEDPLALFATPVGQDQRGVGVLHDLLKQPALEHLSAPFDARFEASGEIGVLLGHGQFQTDLGLNEQPILLDLDRLTDDRNVKFLRGAHGDALRWRGGVAMRALLSFPSQILQIRAQTGVRQEKV